MTAPEYQAVAALLQSRPTSKDRVSMRVEWLFSMANALEDLDLAEDADSTREAAIGLIRDVVSEVSGSAA